MKKALLLCMVLLLVASASFAQVRHPVHHPVHHHRRVVHHRHVVHHPVHRRAVHRP